MRHGKASKAFRDVPEKANWARKIRQTTLPETRYEVFFTPRSSSSRLADILDRAGGLSSPGECFNPAHLPNLIRAFGAQSLAEYTDLLMRRRGKDNVFGCEVTALQFSWVFESEKRFAELISPTSAIWLIREDIIAQAVSLSRMSQSGQAHKIVGSPAQVVEQTAIFEYRPLEIRKKIAVLIYMEWQTEKIIQNLGMTPLCMSYEMLIAQSPADVVARIAGHIGAKPHNLENLSSDHQKIGDGLNLEFIERYRDEHPRLMRQINKQRKARLAARSW